MHLRGLDLNLLVVLNALLEEQNITRTGRRIYLSQSATSGALARLREFFDDELLVQIGHKMVLTPLAESLVQPVSDLLLHAQNIIDQKPRFDPSTSTRQFRIMTSDYMAAVLMTRAVPRLQELAPALQIDIIPLGIAPEEQLERGEIDLLMMPEQFLSTEHPSRELFTDTYVCIAWAENTSIGTVITNDQYFSTFHVGIRYGMGGVDSLEEWIFQHTGQVRQMGLTTTYSLIPHMVVGTKRIATVHRLMAKMFADLLPIRLVEPELAMPVIVEKIQWHRFREKDPGIAWLRKILRSTAREMVADTKTQETLQDTKVQISV